MISTALEGKPLPVYGNGQNDRRYATDDARIRSELGWAPGERFDTGLEKTVQWYVDHRRADPVGSRSPRWTAVRARGLLSVNGERPRRASAHALDLDKASQRLGRKPV